MKKKTKTKTETWVNPQIGTKCILANYYNDIVTKLNNMEKRKTKPSQKQMMKQFDKITEKYAQIIEVHLGKAEIIKLEIDLLKGWEKTGQSKKSIDFKK